MFNVAIIGSGKIGNAIARLLHFSGAYDISVADVDRRALELIADELPVTIQSLDVTDHGALVEFLEGKQAVLSACPYFVNPGIARAAQETGGHYFDLTEDRETTSAVMEIAKLARKGQVFMPQCGLAPGFISILANDLCRNFDQIDAVKMRVGALPQYPSNMMMYNLTWSTDGLINEYCNSCQAIRDGILIEVLPLEGLELFSLDGTDYEAFNTSGGLGTLCRTLEGRVRSLDYKTVRYKGHQYLMQFLINDLHMGRRRELMKEILEAAVPVTMQDVTLIFCTASGWISGCLTQHSNARKIYPAEVGGVRLSSIQITTAAGICAVVDLHLTGRLTATGFVCQESIPFDLFLQNRFGAHYVTDAVDVEPLVRIEPIIPLPQ